MPTFLPRSYVAAFAAALGCPAAALAGGFEVPNQGARASGQAEAFIAQHSRTRKAADAARAASEKAADEKSAVVD